MDPQRRPSWSPFFNAECAVAAHSRPTLNIMKCTYELRRDVEGIARLQQASQQNPFSLKITHGLIGSSEWWSAIQSGSLALHRVEGVVSVFWPGQGRAGPAEFQLRTSTGVTSSWPCEMDPSEAEQVFKLGRQVTVEYVVQELKVALNGRAETQLPLSIWLHDAQPIAAAGGFAVR